MFQLESERDWLGERGYQHCLGSIDVGDSFMVHMKPDATLEKENWRCGHVYRQKLISILQQDYPPNG